jgi:hypothetical protein
MIKIKVMGDPYLLREGRESIIVDMLQCGEKRRDMDDGRTFFIRTLHDGTTRVEVADNDRGWARFSIKIFQ